MREIDWPENSFCGRAGARRRGRPGHARGRRAVAPLAALHRGRGRPRRASSACAWSSRSARCWPTCRTAARSAITGIASDEALVERLGFEPPSYEGPTGIVGVLHHACADGGPAVGEPVGVGAALRGRVAQPEGGAGAGPRVRGHRRPGGRRRRARGGGRGLRAPGHRGGGERPGGQGVRGAARDRDGRGRRPRTRPTRASSPQRTRSRATSSVSCASAARRSLDKGP